MAQPAWRPLWVGGDATGESWPQGDGAIQHCCVQLLVLPTSRGGSAQRKSGSKSPRKILEPTYVACCDLNG